MPRVREKKPATEPHHNSRLETSGNPSGPTSVSIHGIEASLFRAHPGERGDPVGRVPIELPLQPRRVLFVCHRRADRELLRVCATHKGFSVDLASGASEAIRLCTTHEYNIILAAADLPHFDGVSLPAPAASGRSLADRMHAVARQDA